MGILRRLFRLGTHRLWDTLIARLHGTGGLGVGRRPGRGRLSRVTALAATFRSVRGPSDEMRDYWRHLTNVEGVDTLLKFLLRNAHALVLPEVLDPGADEVGFQVAAGVGGVVEHPPSGRSAAAAGAHQPIHHPDKLLGMARIDPVLDGHQYRSLFGVGLCCHRWLGPVHRRGEI
jgi:hypothetical protein